MDRQMRWARFTAGLAIGALGLTAGCAKLDVKKVPIDQRIAGHDHIDGFRYYLSRPYVVVKHRIAVSTQQSVVAVVDNVLTNSVDAPVQHYQGVRNDKAIRFLDGPRAGQTVKLSDLEVTSPGSADVRRLSDAEVAQLQKALRDEAVTRTANSVADSTMVGTRDALTANTDSLHNAAFTTFSSFDPAKVRTKSVNLTGNIDVVFLPDLDEQYAVKSKNFLSKTTFGLVFRNGWELTDVSGEHDSTPVAIELLNTISKAVDSAKTIATAGLSAGGGGAPPKDTASFAKSLATDKGQMVRLYYLTQTTYIKPGLYRINKPWEAEAGAPMPVGCGLLAKLGLTTVTEVQLNLLRNPSSS
ncbi:MAG: hypothetical protein NVSMB9_01020 [Isosphaeraceae bacterium]